MSSISKFAQQAGYGHMVEPEDPPDPDAMLSAMAQRYDNPALAAEAGEYSEMWAGNAGGAEEAGEGMGEVDPMIVRRMIREALMDKASASDAYQAAQMEAAKK